MELPLNHPLYFLRQLRNTAFAVSVYTKHFPGRWDEAQGLFLTPDDSEAVGLGKNCS